MKATYRAVLMAAALVFILPLSARSEIKEGSFEVTPFGGYNFFETKQNLEDSPVYGVRFGYNFTPHWGIEGVVEYIDDSRVDDETITGAIEGQYRSPIDDVDLTFYHLDAVYHFMPEDKLNPFVLVGFGGARYSEEITEHDNDMAAINVGVGAKYWLADRVALRVDVQDHIVTEFFQETYHNIGTTVGITFAFGGGEKQPAPAPVAKKPEEAAPKKVIFSADSSADALFDFDKSTVKPAGKKALDKFAADLKGAKFDVITVTGYTDRIGSHAYNMKLSMRRAEAVKAYLVESAGIPAGKITTKGVNGANPVTNPGECKGKKATKELVTCLGADRRVEVEVVATQTSK